MNKKLFEEIYEDDWDDLGYNDVTDEEMTDVPSYERDKAYETSLLSDMKPMGTPEDDESAEYDGLYTGYTDPNPEDWEDFESEWMTSAPKPLGRGRFEVGKPTLAGVGEGHDYEGGYAEIVDYDPFEEGLTKRKARFFESLINFREASGNATANAIAKQLTKYDGSDAFAPDLVAYISKFLGQASATGTQGLVNDLPGYYQGHKDVENMILAAAAIRCDNVKKALDFYNKYGKQLSANIDPKAVAAAIQAAQQDQTLSLQQAQQQVQPQK